MIYPQKLTSKKGELIVKILIVVSIIIGFLLVIINKLTTPNLHWAGYCNAGIIYIWITVLYSINKNINIAGHVLIQTIAISILMLYIDYKMGFHKWSLNIAIPISIIIANVTMLILTIISHKKYIRYTIYQLIIVLLSSIPVFLIYEKIISNIVLSYVAIGISMLNFIVCLFLCARDIKEAVIRNFHIWGLKK